MLYYVGIYIKYVTWLVLVFLVSLISYKISAIDHQVSFAFAHYTLYTKQSVLIAIFLLSGFCVIKFFSLVLRLNFYLTSLGIRFSGKVEALKSFFGSNNKTSHDILTDILSLKRKKLYRDAFRITSQNYLVSDKILFWHSFFLLKLGRKREFIRIFKTRPCGRAVKLFLRIYLKNKFRLTKLFLIRRYYVQNPDSQVFTYIYAMSLFERGYIKKSQNILMNFLHNKQILMTDLYCSYLMNLLAIKIEKQLNSESVADFTINYKENIGRYHEFSR